MFEAKTLLPLCWSIIIALSLIATASNLRADTATWKGGTGTYSTASSWSGGVVPINGSGKTYDVIIDGQTTSNSAVTFNSGSNVVVNSLSISAGDRLDFASNNGIGINYALNNAGTMSFTGGFVSLGGDGSINTGAGTLITGGGTVLLSNTFVANATNFSIFRASVIGSGTITKLAGVDSGTLMASGGTLTVNAVGVFDNAGTTRNIGFGTLILNATTVTNEGLILAYGSGVTINASQFTNNAQGKIQVYGSELDLNVPYVLTRDDEFSLDAGELTFDKSLTTKGHTFNTGTSTFVDVKTLNNNGGTFTVNYQASFGNTTNSGGSIHLDGGSENSNDDNTLSTTPAARSAPAPSSTSARKAPSLAARS